MSGITRAMIARDTDAAKQALASRPVLYVSGPMRGGPGDMGPWQNTRLGILVGQAAWRAGWHPIVPHLNAIWEIAAGPLGTDDEPDGVLGWLDLDFSSIAHSDALLRLPGKSEGAAREVMVARALGVPVFFVPSGEASLRIPGSEVLRRVQQAGGQVTWRPVGGEVQPPWRWPDASHFPEVDLDNYELTEQMPDVPATIKEPA